MTAIARQMHCPGTVAGSPPEVGGASVGRRWDRPGPPYSASRFGGAVVRRVGTAPYRVAVGCRAACRPPRPAAIERPSAVDRLSQGPASAVDGHRVIAQPVSPPRTVARAVHPGPSKKGVWTEVVP